MWPGYTFVFLAESRGGEEGAGAGAGAAGRVRVWVGCCAPNRLARSKAGALERGTASTVLKAWLMPE